MRSFALTDKGIKRKNNEDSILVNDYINLYIVADGIGGLCAGDVASKKAVNAINTHLINERQSDVLHPPGDDSRHIVSIREAIERANQEVFAYSKEHCRDRKMGTTVSLAFVQNGKVFTGNVGDSRVYRLRNGTMEQLTKDHSKAQKMVDMGLLSEEEAEKHHSSHVLTKAVGIQKTVEPDIDIHSLEEGDLFLLSSDGIFMVLSPSTVEDILKESGTMEEKCHILIDKTLQGGAPDNASVILLEV